MRGLFIVLAGLLVAADRPTMGDTRSKPMPARGPLRIHPTNRMRRGTLRVTIPDPHGGVIDPGLIRHILRQAGITLEEWSKA